MLTMLQSGYIRYCCFIVNGTAERRTATTEYNNGHSVQKQQRVTRMWQNHALGGNTKLYLRSLRIKLDVIKYL